MTHVVKGDCHVKNRPRGPNHKPTIEHAVSAHFNAIGLPMRPFAWIDEPRSAFLRGQALERDPAWDAHCSNLATDVVSEFAPESSGDSYFWRADEARFTVKNYFFDTAWSWRLREVQQVARSAAGADYLALPEHTLFLVSGILEEIAAAATFKCPATDRVIEAWRPLVEAFEAGLFLHAFTPGEVLCVLRPTISIVDGHVHRADGPAVWWPSGEQYFFWRGVPVSDWMIEKPDLITIESIRAEPNQEVRR